nr:putative reverse transcriptase domain-containing protein [Tanacetum cinerariifolium]
MLHVLRVEMVINSPWMLSRNWLVQKQTAFGKDISNPLMADNLPKIVWFSTHHITCMKSWLVQKQTALGKDTSNPFMAGSLPKTILYSFLHEICFHMSPFEFPFVYLVVTNIKMLNRGIDSPLLGVDTPRSDEDRLKLMELMVFLMKKGVCDEFGLNVARLSKFLLSGKYAAEGFKQMIDFLSGSYINHALTVNPHVYISCIKQFWNTAVVKRSERVGDVAYKLDLPEELSRVHNTFHMSNLKKCHADEPLAVPLDGLHFDDKLHFVEEPVEIVDREVKRLNRSQIPLVKVRWNSKRCPEITWECEDQFQKKYPHLFARTAPSSSVTS